MKKRTLDTLRKIVSKSPRASFRPMAFFVARCGVLTVVFDGFSKAILELKKDVERLLPHLEPEHEGSTWPKVTLGVLRDDAVLSARDIVRLRDIADDWNGALRSDGDVLEVDRLAVVEYACRSLEDRHQTVHLPLAAKGAAVDPPEPHARYVQSIVDQFSRERMDRYAAELEKKGHREVHYRSPARGWSLVAEVPPGRLPMADALIEQVERLVPEKYCRLSPDSRHITIRSLDAATKEEGRTNVASRTVPGGMAD